MVLSKKIVSSIALIFSLGFIYFRVSTVYALEHTSNASLLPSTGDAFSVWPIVIGVLLVVLAVVLFIKKKYKKNVWKLAYASKRFFMVCLNK
ncbi:LPXTG cell wall anchor domain-containing protein [Listeria innocua]|uniref:LPXTG cell wall anchor domain-containing protein n=1 Tax=Listeria innocua TaxID=1642 RepID=UPI001888D8EF|nr:LPXTG cell wall anchor domain-containing protein [Listeria innocua]MBF2433363.1 LPXTG cell wall anchor domain-containing protein [Listeria innocua]